MRRSLPIAVAAVALIAAGGAGAVTSGAVLDQSAVEGGCSSGIGYGPPTFSKAQTFTAGRTGLLTDVVLPLANDAGIDLTVSITTVSGGIPGTVLSTVDVPAGSVGSSETSYDVAFGSPASVVTGTTYAITLSSTSAGQWSWYCNSSNVYAGGQGLYNSGGGWNDIGFDHAFETYVAPPVVAHAGRLGYCAAAGDTWQDGAAIAAGTFLDLVAGQPSTDPHYTGATPASFGEGYGLTCDALPALGFKDTGYRVDSTGRHTGTANDLFEYFTH